MRRAILHYTGARKHLLYGSTDLEKIKIESFVDYYGVDMSAFMPSDVDAYSSFQAFLLRKMRHDARPLRSNGNPTTAMVCADAKLAILDPSQAGGRISTAVIKSGLANLVMDIFLGAKFEDGPVACFSLSLQSYRRFYSPVTGQIREFRSVPPAPVSRDVDDLSFKAREYVVINSPDFGEVLIMAVGENKVGDARSVLVLRQRIND